MNDGLWSESEGMVGCARRSIGCDTIFGGGGTVRFSLGIAMFYRGHLYLLYHAAIQEYLPLHAILG